MYIGGGSELNIFFAIDGNKGPNLLGKDIFAITIANNVTLPRGAGLAEGTLNAYTNKPGSAGGCSYALTRIIRDGWQIKYF